MPHIRALTRESPSLRLAAQGLGIALLTLAVIYVLSGRELPLLLAALAGIFCVWLFGYPHWGVLAIFAFWFVRFSPTLLGSRYLQLSHIIAALLLVPLGLRLLRDRELWVWRVPQVKYLIAIGVLFGLSTVWADYKYPVTLLPELDRTASMAQEFVTHLLFLVFFLYFINTPRKLLFAVWLTIGLVVVSVGSAYVGLLAFPEWRRTRAAFGLGLNPTVFPYVCLFGASLLWGYYSAARTTRSKRWIPPLLVALPVMAIASGSRTGLLQLLIFGTLVVVDRSGGWSRSKQIRGIFLLACAALLASALVPAFAVLRSTTFELTSTSPGGRSLIDRVNTIYAGLSMVASDPIFGVGLGNFPWVHAAATGLRLVPHNAYLWALAEGGIGVLVLYLLLLYVTYRMLRRMEAAAPPEIAWMAKGFRFNLVLLAAYSMSDDAWLNDLFYFLLAATVVLYRLWQAHLPPSTPNPRRPAAALRPAGSPR
jgi:O-antigen ligase